MLINKWNGAKYHTRNVDCNGEIVIIIISVGNVEYFLLFDDVMNDSPF